MMPREILYFINQHLFRSPGKQDVRFGGFIMMLVGDFQQLQPVRDSTIYE